MMIIEIRNHPCLSYYIQTVLCGTQDKCGPRVSRDLWQHHWCHADIRDNIHPVTDCSCNVTFVIECSALINMPLTQLDRGKKLHPAAANKVQECSVLMRLWSKEREEFDAEINLGNCDQFIRLGRVSEAHQPGKWVILKSAMSGLNINVSHKSSWMLSSSRLKNSNHLMMTLVFPRNIKLLSFGNSASCYENGFVSEEAIAH